MSTADWVAGRHVLVTGAGGFAGSHLTERLVALGARVRAAVRYTSSGGAGWLDASAARGDIEIVRGDIRDADFVARAARDVSAIFHLAALIGIPYSYEAPQAYVATNVSGTLNVLQAAQAQGVDVVVHTSTSEVYGSARFVPMDEAHPLQAQSPYAATKIAADKLAESFHRSFGLPVVTVRPFNMYGPRQSMRAIVPTIIAQALTQSEIRLGSRTPTRDLTYVLDTVDGFIRLGGCRAAIGEVVNLGTGVEVSIGDLARRVLTAVGRDLPIVQDDVRLRPAASEVDRLCANAVRAAELTDWRAARDLDQGLSETLSWFRHNVNRYNPSSFAV